MRIAVLGRTEWLLSSIWALAHAGYELVLIVTTDESPHYGATAEDFRAAAAKLGVPFLHVSRRSDMDQDRILAARPDIGVSVNWPWILGDDVLSIFPLGILNAHAGDLPQYRGNACPNWAILRGEEHMGLTVHGMESDSVDTGVIYAKRLMPLTPNTYIGDCYRWIQESVPEMFVEVVGMLSSGSGTLNFPAHSRAEGFRCYPRRPSDAEIDWTRSAEDIHRLVRASSAPFGGAFTTLDGHNFRIWRATPVVTSHLGEICAVPGQVLGQDGQCLFVACGTGTMRIEEWSHDFPEVTPKNFTSAIRLGT